MDYRELPPELRPLSAWAYFGYELLYAVPLVGWIFLICHAIGARNVNKRSFARSFFCVYVIEFAKFAVSTNNTAEKEAAKQKAAALAARKEERAKKEAEKKAKKSK